MEHLEILNNFELILKLMKKAKIYFRNFSVALANNENKLISSAFESIKEEMGKRKVIIEKEENEIERLMKVEYENSSMNEIERQIDDLKEEIEGFSIDENVFEELERKKDELENINY